MATTMNGTYLGLLLDSPMQSWGYQSRFDNRTTLSYPTKSGIVGMLCAAMGIPKSDRHRLTQLAEIPMQVYTLVKNRNHLHRLIDFHTVGGGYDYPEQRLNISPKADGSKGSTVVTRREYLFDAAYAVILSCSQNTMAQNIGKALLNPKWGIWFGRKSCIPAAPVFQGIFSTAPAALTHIVSISNGKPVRQISDVNRFEDGTDFLRDRPIDFQARQYSIRRILDEPIDESGDSS